MPLLRRALSRARDNLSLSRAQRYSDSRAQILLPRLRNRCTSSSARPIRSDMDGAASDAARAPEPPDLKRAAREHDGRGHRTLHQLPAPLSLSGDPCSGLAARAKITATSSSIAFFYRVLGWMAEQAGSVTAEALMAETDAAGPRPVRQTIPCSRCIAPPRRRSSIRPTRGHLRGSGSGKC